MLNYQRVELVTKIWFRPKTTPVAWLRGVSVLKEKNVCDAGLKVFLNQSYPRMNKHRCGKPTVSLGNV